MPEITFDHKKSTLLKESFSNGSYNHSQTQSSDTATTEILFCDVPYNILVVQPLNDVSPRTLTLEEFYQEHRLLLPVGIRSIFRARISQTAALPLSSSASSSPQQQTLSYRDTKNAIQILNPWFHYTEIFHQCRTEYNLCHRSMDMLSTQSLNKDLLRELLVLLYGQKFMFTAPDLYTEFHLFLSDFDSKFKDQPKQNWIDLKRLNEIYGCRNSVGDGNTNHRHPSVGSLSTIPQSNTGTSFKKEKIIPNMLIEV